jgi:hypothetical protein
MYIDIEPNDNLDEACMATFNTTGQPKVLRAIHLDVDGAWTWCAVSGWNDGKPAPAWLTTIEESGDGPALLVHGGNQGIRLARITDAADADSVHWDLAASDQWGEGFLICVPDTAHV